VCQAAEGEAVLQRLSVVGAEDERQLVDLFLSVADSCVQLTQSVLAEARRVSPQDGLDTAFPAHETLQDYLHRQGLGNPVVDPAVRRLCHSVLLNRPLRSLASVLELIAGRMSRHAHLFTRFPAHMKASASP